MLLVAALVLDLAVLFALPCPHSYNRVFTPPGAVQLQVPSGSNAVVTVTWFHQQGLLTNMTLLNGPSLAAAHAVTNDSGIQGVLEFRAGAGGWWLLPFTSGGTLAYTVSYTTPLL